MLPGFLEKILSAQRAPDAEELYIIPGRAVVEPGRVDLSTLFSKRVRLRIPIASSPMDTVSEWEMAVSAALAGGIGVVHRNMSVEEQVEQVSRVKAHPPTPLERIFHSVDEPCGRAVESMRSAGLRQIPLVSRGMEFAGYARYHELVEACREGSEPLASMASPGEARSLSEIREALRAVEAGAADLVAITSPQGVLLGSVSVRTVMEEISPATDDSGRLVVAAAISPLDAGRASKLDRLVDALVSDTANFHNTEILRASARLVKHTSADFVAGNIGTPEAAIDAVEEVGRVDGLRVGVGGGSICTTPSVSGIYSPTLWAVASVRDALESRGSRIPIIADGGLRSASDILKALALGAWSAMVGNMLAGSEEAPAPLVEIGNSLYKPYRGMASSTSMARRYSMDRYARVVKRLPEGVGDLVPYRGPARRILRDAAEALRIGMGYAGARSVEELWERARLVISPRKRALGGEG